MPPGAYVVSAELQGFATATAKVTLQVDTPATLDPRLELAGLTEAVTVVATSPLVNTVDATIGNAFNERQVRQLPLMTRNVVELLSLQPGVTPTGEVVGARRDQNNITLDGVDVNDNQTAGLENANGTAPIPGYNSVRQPMQVGSETLKPADRVGVPIRPDRDVMRAVADVDPGGVRMHHVQAGVLDPQPPGQFFSLLPIQSCDVCGDRVGPPLMRTRCGPVAMGV